MIEWSQADLSSAELDAMEHALGLNHIPRRTRNFFAAGPDDAVTWDALVEKGLAFEVKSLSPADRTFMVSTRGKSLMGVLL